MKPSVIVIMSCLIVSTCVADPAWAQQETDPAAPVIHYHFKVDGEFSGGEDLWINQVHLGKMPFTMTLDELKAKVPVMEEPPEGYADENKDRLNGHWFRIELHDLVLEGIGLLLFHSGDFFDQRLEDLGLGRLDV